MKTRQPFFIVGSARSGTTLLQVMLGSISGVHIVSETKFFPRITKRLPLIGDPATEPGFERLIAATMALCRETGQPVDEAELGAVLQGTERTPSAVFDELLDHIRRRVGARRIGEKTPGHLGYAGELLAAFPDSQIVTIVRDGRDVAASQKAAFAASTVLSIGLWRRDYRVHQSLADRVSDRRYLSVRYEDLVTEPRSELRRVCEFLGEAFDESILDFHRRSEPGFLPREEHKSGTLEPITGSRVGRFRDQLTTGEIALCQALAGRELAAGGYALETVPRSRAWPTALRLAPRTIRQWARRQREGPEQRRVMLPSSLSDSKGRDDRPG